MFAAVKVLPFKLKNPRKGTETIFLSMVVPILWSFQIKESPEGDWNRAPPDSLREREDTFKLKNPRKGTETSANKLLPDLMGPFQIKESPEGDWNRASQPRERLLIASFQIKESPEGDWNLREISKIKDARFFQIKESPEGDWNFH